MIYLSFLFIIIIILSYIIVFSKNTIISMLCLIWCFIFTGFCFLLLGAEFLAFILIIVYGSAISILFLFIIMLLNLRLIDIYYTNIYYIPLCFFISIFLIYFCISFLFKDYYFLIYNNSIIWLNYYNIFNFNNNLYNFGIILYNYYYIFVIIASIILLLAMIGSILLIFNKKRKIYYLSDLKINNKYYVL